MPTQTGRRFRSEHRDHYADHRVMGGFRYTKADFAPEDGREDRVHASRCCPNHAAAFTYRLEVIIFVDPDCSSGGAGAPGSRNGSERNTESPSDNDRET